LVGQVGIYTADLRLVYHKKQELSDVRGKSLIERADVIIYAGSLVNPQLLEYAKKDCEIHNSAYMTLEQVIDVIKSAEHEGKMTVRLHTGDPSLYGAIREQMDRLDELGIKYDICPRKTVCHTSFDAEDNYR